MLLPHVMKGESEAKGELAYLRWEGICGIALVHVEFVNKCPFPRLPLCRKNPQKACCLGNLEAWYLALEQGLEVSVSYLFSPNHSVFT